MRITSGGLSDSPTPAPAIYQWPHAPRGDRPGDYRARQPRPSRQFNDCRTAWRGAALAGYGKALIALKSPRCRPEVRLISGRRPEKAHRKGRQAVELNIRNEY